MTFTLKSSIFAAILISLAGTLFADDTVLNNGREGPEPLNMAAGEESPVQMVSEELEFHFDPEKTSVDAHFHFLNSTKADIRQTIGFPDDNLAFPSPPGGDRRFGGPLENMKTFVDGKEVPSAIKSGQVQWAADGKSWMPAGEGKGFTMVWHTVDVDFPAGKEVLVERSYVVGNSGRFPWFFFTYIVHTGGAWKGNIGKLKARVILGRGLTIKNLQWRPDKDLDFPHPITRPKRSEWKIVSPTDLGLEWTNFKPSKDDGKQCIEFAICGKGLDEEGLIKKGWTDTQQ